jgi:GT2 family glycosyltransferase
MDDKQKLPIINISLVLYNSKENDLIELFQSIQSQKNVQCFLYVFDNSPVSQKHLINRLSSILSNEIAIDYYFSKENVGFGKGHNHNFQRSSQKDYFLVINPDVSFLKNDLFESIILEMNSHENCGLASTRVFHRNGTEQYVHRLLPRFQNIVKRFIFSKIKLYNSITDYQHLLFNDQKKYSICPSISGCFMFFRTELFKKIKGFDENIFMYFEDVDISRRTFIASGGGNIVLNNLCIFHIWSQASYKSIRNFYFHVRSLFYYFSKNGFLTDREIDKINQLACEENS